MLYSQVAIKETSEGVSLLLIKRSIVNNPFTPLLHSRR
jgi:hypothetical protein